MAKQSDRWERMVKGMAWMPGVSAEDGNLIESRMASLLRKQHRAVARMVKKLQGISQHSTQFDDGWQQALANVQDTLNERAK